MKNLEKEVVSIARELKSEVRSQADFGITQAIAAAVYIQQTKVLIEGLELFEKKLDAIYSVLDGLRDDIRNVMPPQ